MKKRSALVAVEILIFAGLVTISAVLLLPLQNAVLDGITALRDSFLISWETKVGAIISYKSMSPAPFGALDLRQVAIYNAGHKGGEPFIFVDRLRLRYSLWSLVTGHGVHALLSLHIDRPVINFDKESILDIKTSKNSAGNTGKDSLKGNKDSGNKDDGHSGIIDGLIIERVSEIIRAFPDNFHVRVTKGKISAALGENDVALNFFSLNALSSGGNLEFKAEWVGEARINGFDETAVTVSVPGSAEGSFSAHTVRADGRVSFPEMRTELFSLRRISFIAVWTKESLVLRKIDDYSLYDASFYINFNRQSYHANFSADRFSPSDILTLHGALASYNKYLDVEIDGGINFEKLPANEGSAGISYNVFLKSSPRIGQSGRRYSGGAADSFIEFNAFGSEKSVVIQRLNISLERGSVNAEGTIRLSPFIPSGSLRFSRFYFNPSGETFSSPLTGVVHITGSPVTVRAFSDTLDIGGTELLYFNCEAVKNKSDWDIALSTMINDNKLSARAKYIKSGNIFDVNAGFNSISLKDIINLCAIAVPLPYDNTALGIVSGDVKLTSDISFSTDFKKFSYKAPRLIVDYSGVKNINAVAELRGNETESELVSCHIDYSGTQEAEPQSIDIKAKADYSNAQKVDIDISAIVKEKDFKTQVSVVDKKNINVTSSYGLHGSAVINELGGIEGKLQADSAELPFFSKPAYLSMDAAVNFRGAEDWVINLRTLDVQTSRVENLDSIMHIDGVINQNRALFSKIVFGRGGAMLSGDAVFNFKKFNTDNSEADTAPALRIALNSDDGLESLFVEGRAASNAEEDKKSFNISVNANDFKLYRFFAPEQFIVLSGKFDIGIESEEKFYSSFDIKKLSGRSESSYWTLSTKFSLSNDEFESDESIIHYGSSIIKVPYLSILPSLGTLDTAVYFADSEDSNISAEFAVNMAYEKTDSWADIKNVFNSFSGKANLITASFIDSAQPSDKNGGKYVFDFEKNGTLIKVSGSPDRMLDAEIETTGFFFVNLNAPLGLQGTISGTIAEEGIDITASNILFDLKKLRHIIPHDFPIISTDGIILADVLIQGTLSEPQFYGSAQAFGARVILPEYIPVEIGPAPINGSFTGDSLVLDPIVAPVAKGEALIEVELHFDRWKPRNYDITVTALPQKPLPYAVQFSPIVSHGFVSGKLSISKEDTSIWIKGDLIGNDTAISLNSTRDDSEENQVSDYIVQTDVTIKTDKRVEFIWPTEQFPVIRANIDAGEKGIAIKSNSLTDEFFVAGDIELRGGEVYYFQRSFYIKEGRLVFAEIGETYEPLLSVTAESREQNADGPVRLIIIVEDQPLASFTPRIISEPALSQVEILSMLGNTLTGAPDEENKLQVQGTLNAATDVLAQFYLYRRAEQALRDFLHIDMLSLRTQTLQNLAFQYIIPNTSETEGVEVANNTVGIYFDNTTVLAGKYIGKGSDMFVQAMVATRYDKNKIDMGGVTFDVDIGLELTSPLLNVRWDIRPVQNHIRSFWIEDTKITLQKTWHFR